MKEVVITSKVVGRGGGSTPIRNGQGPQVDLSDYLLKAIWDEVWELRTDSNGQDYIFGKLPVVTQYGITMYAGNENLDIPSIYAGIPVDGTTITKREDGTLMVNPNIELGGASNWDELEGKPSWITDSKPKYNYNEIEGTPDLGNYALRSDVTLLSEKLNDFLEGSDTDNIINKWKELEIFLNGLSESDNLATILQSKVGKDYVDGNFVTLEGIPQTIKGEKNFTGGLKVNGSPIYYDTEKKYWKFEGDLLVTGGVTMYGNDSEFIPSTIMDAIQTDGVTIRVNPTTKNLEVIGNLNGATTLGGLSNVGTWADSVADVDRIMYQAAGSSNWVAKSLSSIGGGGGVSGDYLPLSGGVINSTSEEPLTINSSAAQSRLLIQRYGANRTTVGHHSNFGSWIYDHDSGNSIGISVVDGSPFFNDGLFKTLLHSGNYSNYALPLTGGTITGDLGLSGTLNNRSHFLFAEDVDSARWIVTDKYWANQYLLWHSGNDGSGSGLDADLLDGVQESGFCRHLDGVPITSHRGIGYGFADSGWIFNGPALSIGYSGDNYLMQLQAPADYTALHFRNRMNGAWGSWKEIAFTDSNVASATKLQTARTVWGQSFDGSGNVNGDLILYAAEGGNMNSEAGKLCFHGMSAFGWGNGCYITGIHHDTYGRRRLSFFQSNEASNYPVWNEVMTIVPKGNVGIGTTSPSYKLHVQGSGYFGEFVTVNGNVNCIALEIIGTIPYIDFHYNNSSADYTARIVQYSSGQLTLEAGLVQTSSNFLASGGITMYSDQRKKTILNHVELSLKQIADAPLIEHFYNSDDKRTTHVGSIAQYWANMNDWFCKLDSEGYYTMEIQNCALASAISIARELDRYESKTDKTINKLKKKIALLEEEVEQLRSRL